MGIEGENTELSFWGADKLSEADRATYVELAARAAKLEDETNGLFEQVAAAGSASALQNMGDDFLNAFPELKAKRDAQFDPNAAAKLATAERQLATVKNSLKAIEDKANRLADQS